MFAVRDEVVAKVVEAMIGRLSSALPRNRPKNLDAVRLGPNRTLAAPSLEPILVIHEH
jgi:hypothetical protein